MNHGKLLRREYAVNPFQDYRRYCQQHHITMTCVADGHLLDFLETGEICTIVGTALDNATESVETEPAHDKRLIRGAAYAPVSYTQLDVYKRQALCFPHFSESP